MLRYSLVTLALCASALAATPKGLSTSAWSSIRSEYQRHRQAAFAVEGGWQARNYSQDWSMFFDGRGFEVKPQHGAWRWGLRLASYGYPGQQRRVEKARAVAVPDVEKFSYQWDSTIREWYVNGAGLEHGYTLESRPGNGTGLQLHLEVLGTLQARVAGDGQGVAFLEGGGGPVVLNYGGLKVTDATGRLLASRFYGEAGGLRLEVDDAGARYPVTVDPIAQQQAYLKASNVGADDRFGSSVAVSGDTVVVGAPGESSGNGSNQADNSATQSGAAYVFTRTGVGDWTQQAYLKASNVEAGDLFGQSVAVSGNTVVVGAWGEDSANGSNQADNSAEVSGAVYVFTRTSGVWTQQAYLKASNVERNDIFGWSVAVSADTLLVGAPGEASGNGNQADNSANNSGAAYVFTRANGVWTQQAYLKASNVGAGDEFGHSVAVTGDTVVVGAPKEDSSSPNQGALFVAESGAAYVFTRTSSVWTQQAYLKASSVTTSGFFGWSVTVSGDTVVVGAYGEGSGDGRFSPPADSFTGAAYVFTRSSGVWTRQAHLKASNPGRDEFGWSVAVSGDTVVVGAPGEDSGNASDQADNSAADSGAAYVFTRTGGVWSQQAYLKASNVDANDQFGRSVAVSGDTVVVGTYWEAGNGSNQADGSAPQSGAAYVFTVFPAQAVSLDVPKQIPDNSFAGLASVLTIADPAIIADLNLTLSLSHPCLASLDVSLTPPGGTPVKLLVAQNGLIGQAGGCGQNFVVTTLDDQASTLLTSGSSPGYAGSFNVNHASVGNNPLAKFNGLLAAGTWTLTVADRAAAQTGTLVAWGLTITPAAAPPNTTGLRFVPVTPCRLVDTREATLGAFGTPALVAGASRAFVIPQKTSCGIPASAAAYSLNLTVVPKGPLSYVTIWPAGAAQPLVSTLNSPDGRIKANAALVPAGTNGAISVYATNDTELVLDINGYFIDPAVNPQALAFYPLTPCRILDTRNPNGSLGGPVIPGGSRDIPILSSNCGLPANAQAYSVNATVVPSGPLSYLTLWPTGLPQPLVSTLNALTGSIVANAALVPAGTSGSISAFVTSASHLVLDINGYFAPPGAANAQRFFAVTPCRLLDTRNPNGEFGGPVLAAGSARSYRLPLLTSCGLPATATAYSLNATVVPASLLSYLTLWPFGTAQPLVSTLNALDDTIVANAAIVPAGTAGAVASFVTNQTHLILDTNGFFAP